MSIYTTEANSHHNKGSLYRFDFNLKYYVEIIPKKLYRLAIAKYIMPYNNDFV